MTNIAAAKWKHEYQHRGIPSSFRSAASGSVVDFVRFASKRGLNQGTAIDLGCGTGRNTLFLADSGFEVYALDIVSDLIDALAQRTNDTSLATRIHPYCQSVTARWPVDDSCLDVAIDTFCYKHQLEQSQRRAYRRELYRTLKPGGFYLLTLADVSDGYYGPLLQGSARRGDRIIIDPANGIGSVLFSREDVEREFGELCETVQYFHRAKKGPMHGGEYQRVTHVFFMRRTRS